MDGRYGARTTWIDRALSEGAAAAESGDRPVMESYLDATTTRMKQEGVHRPRQGLEKYKQRIACYGVSSSYVTPEATDDEIVADIEKVAEKLLDWRERLNDPMSIAGPARDEINNSNNVDLHIGDIDINASTSSNSAAVIQVSFAEARRKVDALEELSDDEKLMVKGMLSDIEDCNDDSLGERAMRLVKYVGEKTFEVAKAALPALIGKFPIG